MKTDTGWLEGIFPALVTPFTPSGDFDEPAFRRLIERVLPFVHGVVPCGTTGEFVYLSRGERQRVIEVCVDAVAGRVPVVAGTGCSSTRETVRLTRWARDAGADGALVVAPFYLAPDYNEVYGHYRAVDEVGLPIVMYNIPQAAGTHFRWWTAEGGLLDFEHTVAIKDSSGDLPFLAALLEKVKGQVSILVGHDEVVQPALAAGADGAILGSANLVPDVWREVYDAVAAGELETARRRQRDLQTLARLVARHGAPQACKEGLHMMGVDVGDARHPIVAGGVFRREDREELRLQLEALGKIDERSVPFQLGDRSVETRIAATPATPSVLGDPTMAVGEGFAGPPLQETAHIDLLVGPRDGPVGRAIDRALAESVRKEGLGIIVERPRTLIVPTITIRGARARRLFEAAGRGVALAIERSVDDGFLPRELLGELTLIVNAFVHSAAAIERRVELNNYKATRHALRKALEGRPTVDALIAERTAARHPFRYAP
jgi:4-hydroxy-tetrahydrodipicolinate synthase